MLELVWSKDIAILSNLDANALSSIRSPQSELSSAYVKSVIVQVFIPLHFSVNYAVNFEIN